jgi:hypothetical protein
VAILYQKFLNMSSKPWPGPSATFAIQLKVNNNENKMLGSSTLRTTPDRSMRAEDTVIDRSSHDKMKTDDGVAFSLLLVAANPLATASGAAVLGPAMSTFGRARKSFPVKANIEQTLYKFSAPPSKSGAPHAITLDGEVGIPWTGSIDLTKTSKALMGLGGLSGGGGTTRPLYDYAEPQL